MSYDSPRPSPARKAPLPVTGVFVLALLAALYVARPVVVPLLLGVFLSLLLAPIVRGLRRKLRIPTPIGAVLALGLVMGLLGYGVYSLGEPARDWATRLAERWPSVEDRLENFKEPVEDLMEASRQISEATNVGAGEDQPVATMRDENGMFFAVIGSSTQVLLTLLVAVLLAFFSLQSLDSFLAKLVSMLPRMQQKKRAVETSRKVESALSRYLLSITLINGGLGVAVGVAVAIAGLPNPVFWGVLAGLLNFIPYFGAMLGVVVIGVVSLISFDDGARIIAPPLLYAVLNGLESYVVTPLVLGRSLSLSPSVVFVAVLVLGWMWGPAGAFLAVPLAMTAKIAFLEFEALAPLGVLMSEEGAHDAE